MSGERSEPVGSPVKVVKVCFAYVVKPFTGEVVKVCSGSGPQTSCLFKKLKNHMCPYLSKRTLTYARDNSLFDKKAQLQPDMGNVPKYAKYITTIIVILPN